MTTAKPSTRRATPKAASAKSDTKPSTVDEMAEEAVPVDYPPGTPELLSPLSLRPRSRRAEFKRRYSSIVKKYESMKELRAIVEADQDPPEHEKLRISAELDDVYQAIDDVLRIVAADPQVYAVWSDELEDDNVLMTVFNVYQRRAQPGEASSSMS